jgi:hypothetical protein
MHTLKECDFFRVVHRAFLFPCGDPKNKQLPENTPQNPQTPHQKQGSLTPFRIDDKLTYPIREFHTGIAKRLGRLSI